VGKEKESMKGKTLIEVFADAQEEVVDERERCETCRFCNRPGDYDVDGACDYNALLGECRRFPPSLRCEDVIHAMHQDVVLSGWCGEWQPVVKR